MDKCQPISITHFINPSLFWYHKIEVPNEDFYKVTQLEKQIATTCKQTVALIRDSKPVVGDKVVVNFLAWNKYIRASILSVAQFTRTADEYIVWALDYGFPFQTTSNYVHRLPEKYAATIEHVHCGGLAGVLPAEKEFDFMEGYAKTVQQDNWYQRSCDVLEKLLGDAASITFSEQFRTSDGQNWGDLTIVNHKGQEFMASDCLIAINLAISAGPNFRESCLSLKCTKIAPWLSNNGNNKFRMNRFSCTSTGRDVDSVHAAACDDWSKRKVQDWCERNERVGGGAALEPTDSIVEASIDDIAFDDSVSTGNQRHASECSGFAETTRGNLEMSTRLGSAKAKKYIADQVPPKPKAAAFKCNRNDVSNEAAPSSNSHLKYLSEDAILALDREHVFYNPHKHDADTTKAANSRVEKLKCIRKKALCNQSKTITDASTSLTKCQPLEGSALTANKQRKTPTESEVSSSTTKYRQLEESTFSSIYSTDESQLLDVSIKASTLSEVSAASSRARRLYEMRRQMLVSAEIAEAAAKKATAANCTKADPKISKYKEMISKIRERKTSQASSLFQEVDPTEPSTSQSLQFPDLPKQPKNLHGLDGFTVVPAGYDLTKLTQYRDEKNHWHRKKTTLHDHIPHDVSSFDDLASSNHNSSSSSDMFNAPSSNADTNKMIANQNFRHTRPNTEKYKKEQGEENNLLDSSVPGLNWKTISPNVNADESIKPKDAIRHCEAFNLTAVQEHCSPKREQPTNKSKRRQLKSPALQMKKIDRILRRATFEKKLGNADVLDLNTTNSSASKTDSDNNAELFAAEDGAFASGSDNCENEPTISDTRALVKNRLASKSKASKINDTETVEQLKLVQLEKHLNLELSLVRKPITTLDLPQFKSQELREIDGEKNLQTKFMEHLVLAHSKVPLYPLEKLSEAFLLPEISEEMVNMRMTKVYRVQAYAWPHLLRGNSLFIVNPSQSGKTWCYLPPICSLVSYRIQSGTLAETYGPVAIILVASSTHVELVNKYCKHLLVDIKGKMVTTVPSFGIRNENNAKLQLLNSCGILVATPANLLRLLCENEHESLFNPARLQHLIIDDMDLMRSRSAKDFEAVLKSLFKMLAKSSTNTLALQLVVTSRDWDSTMMELIPLSNQPLLLIGDFLEAAVYGRASISVKFMSKTQKIGTILSFVETHAVELKRLLILCNSDEDVDEVVQGFATSEYPCIGYRYTMQSAEDARILIDEWKQKKDFFQVVVCTDDTLPELKIQNAQNLIHYSMPTSWTKFTARFSSLAQSYENYVCKDVHRSALADESESETTALSLILLDEKNNIQLPRLIDFMTKHKQLKYVQPEILAVSKRVMAEREQERIAKGAILCPALLEFCECDESRCDYRHNLTPYDAVSKTDDTPTSGDMRILILKVFSPTYYTARLLQHKPPDSSKWRELRCSDKAALFGLQQNLDHLNRDKLIHHSPLAVNDLCIYKSSDIIQRARILELLPIKHKDVLQRVKVTVKLIDLGTILSNVKDNELYVCDNKCKEFPAQAIDIRLMGIVPFDNERAWDSRATQAVQNWIMSDIKKDECVHVSINFALASCIWVNNVIVMQRLPNVGQFIYRVNLKRSLIEKNFGMPRTSDSPTIRDIADELGLLNAHDLETDFESCNNDSINLINFSSDGLIGTESEDEAENPKKDLHFTDEENWDAVENNGKNEVYLPLASSNYTFPKEEWCKLPLHQPIKVEIGDERENGNWADIYLQCIDDLHTEKFDGLLNLTNQHIAKVYELPMKPFEDAWFQPMQNCIVKYDDLYLRAKLHGIYASKLYGTEVEERIYRFFLCDYACLITVKAEELYNDILYETTNEIIEYTPYQAVHCRLAAIQLENFAKRFKVSKSYLFAYAVNERQIAPSLNMHSFDILLYECDSDEFNSCEMLNKALLVNGVATLDPETNHLLELDVVGNDLTLDGPEADKLMQNAESPNSGIVNFQQLVESIHKSYELERCDQKFNASQETRKMQKELPDQEMPGSAKICALKEMPTSSLESDEEPLISSNASENGRETSNTSATSDSRIHSPPPQLTVLHKSPHTVWYQTDYIIYLLISAPDIVDYFLEVTRDTLTFVAIVDDQEQTLIMNFLGTIQPQYVSHEIRGLNVVVRLVKSTLMKWPHLLQQSTKMPWLSYNYNAIDRSELERLLPQQRLHLALGHSDRNNEYDSDTDNSESNLYQTFTPIVNSEDIHADCTAEIF